MSNKTATTNSAPTSADDPPDLSLSVVLGTLSSEPRVRELPSGSILLTLEVTCQQTEGNALSVSVAFFDPPKGLHRLTADTRVLVAGQTRRRFYRAGGATLSRTEIVAQRVVPLRQRKRAEAALRAAAAQISAVASAC